MQSDFEPILERQIHHLVNGAEGIWHMGQRDIIWTRISKSGFKKGLRLRHYGDILHAKLLSDYPAIVDKIKVTLVTDAAEVEKRVAVARKVYDERNRRLESMTDESVDTFYSCTLCQSFAPDHVCIITPERLGLCGAYNWLDGKAAFEIDETGPNQPVKKGESLDPVRGVWKGINEFVYQASHKAIKSFAAYSIMDRPMTSCGCFEAICAYVPECNGVMVVNREYQGDTPIGMSFSTLAGNVGGGQQTPGFMGVGKVFLTSRKFLFTEGGFKRLVWMPKELKTLLENDLKKRFEEQGCSNVFDKIADETVATEASGVKAYLEKVGHPALTMPDMTEYAENSSDEQTAAPAQSAEPVTQAVTEEPAAAASSAITADIVEQIKAQVTQEVTRNIRQSLTQEIVRDIISTLSVKFLGEQVQTAVQPQAAAAKQVEVKPAGPTAAQRLSAVKAFNIRKEKCECPVTEVKLGATKAQGGTRGKTYTVGGASCMPFHLWEGKMPNRPLVAMEVFDVVSEKYPASLRNVYGDLLKNPAEMAKACVEKYGADLISVRLEGTHPEKGDRSPDEAVTLVKQVLAAVDVPLIVTGHNHFDKNNEVLKAVAQSCAGENLLLNWVEQDNYRTIAGAAIAYGHSIVSQSPIDVNIGKQMNILLTNMDVKPGQIVMDPVTGATGYGIEYTYSVMERIRLTALNGDKMLAAPIIVAPGPECAKTKESKATEADFPAWGDLARRAAAWELATATSLLYAGADILIMYNPDAAMACKRTIFKLMDGQAKA
jgi:CO dehydrogenase/CO-methylating acetyl-CoA synthase complex beta subunit/CO dehydrogenase/acetyl-CoA synthase delta subunit